jgi:hypothetical protein
MGWLSRSCWHSPRQRSSSVKILAAAETHRAAKTLETGCPSEVLLVGQGIFCTQKPSKYHDISTWESMISSSVLYRIHPDIESATGKSGLALYTEGERHDGTEGPAIVGFQSFAQSSDWHQDFQWKGESLENRLKQRQIVFYGAFMVPETLKNEYSIV